MEGKQLIELHFSRFGEMEEKLVQGKGMEQ